MPNFPILGFVAGTPILTARGLVPIEDLKPGDMLQVQPDDQDHDKPDARADPADVERRAQKFADVAARGGARPGVGH